MSKFKIGDKVLLEVVITRINKKSQIPIEVEFKDRSRGSFEEEHLLDASKTYEDGLADAWELARKVALCDSEEGGYKASELKAIFDKYSLQGVFRSYTIQEALATIEAYEKSQQIQVGDVVEVAQGTLGVITYANAEFDKYSFVDFTGQTRNEYRARMIKKTGRHIDIEHLLEQIRGNE